MSLTHIKVHLVLREIGAARSNYCDYLKKDQLFLWKEFYLRNVQSRNTPDIE